MNFLHKNSVDQIDFRGGFSTIDHLQTSNQVVEKTKYNDTFYLAFIDCEKDCSSILQHIEHKYIRIIESI